MGLESTGDYIGVGFICVMLYGFTVFCTYGYILDDTFGYDWKELLSVPTCAVMLLLAPLTLTLGMLLWTLSGGGHFSDWLYPKLVARAYRIGRLQYSASVILDCL